MNIFAETAPAYYTRDIPVIPLYRKEKRPIPLDWSRYHDHPVEKEQQQAWISQVPDGNIGLVLGKQSGVVMIDIDTEDPRLIERIRSVLPDSPWQRVGAKGMVLAYRYTGVRTFRIKNAAGESLCEHLSERTQVVLPPSIHPTTKRPYTANRELVEVIDNLPALDPQVENILRGALQDAGVELSTSGQSKLTDFVSSGSRDISLTEKAGLFAYAVVRGERTLREAIGMLRSYHQDFVESVAGDDVDVNKHIDNLLRFLRRDVIEKKRMLPEGWDEGLTAEEKRDWGLDFGEDHVQWDFDKIRQFLKDKFDDHPEGSSGRHEAVEKVLDRMAQGNNLSKLEEERILQYVADVGGLGIKITALRGQMRELRSGELQGQSHMEIAEAVLEDMSQFYEIKVHRGVFWKYTGSHWEEIAMGEILGKIATDFGQLQLARRHSDHRGIYNTMLTMAEEGIKSSDRRGVNFANGFLTEDLELVDHDAAYGMTYTLPFRYLKEKAGDAEMFQEFLASSWGEDADFRQKITALQEALCITLFGLGPRFQRVVLLKGVPKSGKSQMLEIAKSLVPLNAKCFVPPNEWSDRFMPAQMHEKLINVCGELSERKRIDGQMFKDIVDGAEMSGQFKGQQIFRFSPRCTHWFASNHTPKTDDSSEGFNRRWLILEFNRPVPADERKLGLGEMIVTAEREAIVAWAVQAMPRLLEANEFTLPDSHKQLIREIAQENNSVRFFIEESKEIRLVPNSKARISEEKLFQRYWSFCLGPGVARPVGSKVFRPMMREMQAEKNIRLVIERNEIGSQEVYYEGITLADA